jgi:hypothetical protein
MSFKTFNCVTDNFQYLAIPAEGWNPSGDTIVVTGLTTLGGYFDCNPSLSNFWGANNSEVGGLTQQDFNELWPLLILILITGACIKKVIHIFHDH